MKNKTEFNNNEKKRIYTLIRHHNNNSYYFNLKITPASMQLIYLQSFLLNYTYSNFLIVLEHAENKLRLQNMQEMHFKIVFNVI